MERIRSGCCCCCGCYCGDLVTTLSTTPVHHFGIVMYDAKKNVGDNDAVGFLDGFWPSRCRRAYKRPAYSYFTRPSPADRTTGAPVLRAAVCRQNSQLNRLRDAFGSKILSRCHKANRFNIINWRNKTKHFRKTISHLITIIIQQFPCNAKWIYYRIFINRLNSMPRNKGLNI